MRICLSMIVKNESTIIERCLQSALPFIDTWAIVDTGSTDGTPRAIKEFFAKNRVEGKMGYLTFQDFAQARNGALALARNYSKADYALLIDADMVLTGTLDRHALTAPAYRVRQRSADLDYWNTRLVRLNVPARYIGVTHEYLAVEGPGDLATLDIQDMNDGGSKGDKGPRDIRLLLKGLEAEPQNGRYMFYLANTYRETGQHPLAIEWYRRRIADTGGWDEEIWAAYFGIARSYLALEDEPNFIKACFDAYNYRPTRGEPLKLLAQFFRERGRSESAMLIAEALAKVDYPETDKLFVERGVYDYGADEEIAISGFYCKSSRRREEAHRACGDLTLHPNEYVREGARKNFIHYARSASNLFGARLQEIDWQPKDGYVPMNPSVCVTSARRLALVRTVNYMLVGGKYVTKDEDGVIRTRNHLVEMDSNWKPVGSVPIEDASGLPRTKFPVEGLEDCRLWRNGEQFFVSATVRDFTEEGRCEMAIAALDQLDYRWRATSIDVVRDYKGHETQKNWMPIVGRPGWFLYFCDPTVVIERTVRGTTERFRSTPPVFLGNLRGGSHLVPIGDSWLAITHEVVWRPERTYLHRFVRFDRKFRAIAVSDPFYFKELGVEFCAGLARDNDWLVASFGVNDRSAHLAFFDLKGISDQLLGLEPDV